MVSKISSVIQEIQDAIPGEIRDLGLASGHPWPRVAGGGKPIRFSFCTAPRFAWTYPRLQVNGESVHGVLLLDVDHPLWWYAAGEAPHPSWAVVNTENGHAHLGFVLQDPVHVYSTARRKPVEYAAAILRGLSKAYKADPGFGGKLTRNPAAPGPGCRTHLPGGGPYSLAELAEGVELPKRKPSVEPNNYLGRNCALFNWAMKTAHRPGHARSDHSCERMVEEQNRILFGSEPLPSSEIASIARSVDRYVTRQWSEDVFKERQRSRGQRSGVARRKASEARTQEIIERLDAGESAHAIAERVGVSARQIYRVKRACTERTKGWHGVTFEGVTRTITVYPPREARERQENMGKLWVS